MNDPTTHQFDWTIKGIYGTWTMTITAAPPDHTAACQLTEFPIVAFTNLTRNFADSVNLYEAIRDRENGPLVHSLDDLRY